MLCLESLPEEILEHIISYLDVLPPSACQNVQEPTPNDLFRTDTPLKNLSRVSKKLLRLVDHLRFLYIRLDFGSVHRSSLLENLSLSSVTSAPLQMRNWGNAATGSVISARLVSLGDSSVRLQTADGESLSLQQCSLSASDRHYIDLIGEHLYRTSTSPSLPLKKFLKSSSIQGKVRSVVLFEQHVASDQADPDAYRDRLRASTLFDLRTFLRVERVVVIAPPQHLATFAGCYSNTSDSWSFDIPYQRIELQQDPTSVQAAERQKSGGRWNNYLDNGGREQDNVLSLNFWKSFEYDEGSSLNAYGTYHYFEKRPPSIFNRTTLKILRLGSWLRRFAYTAIFPHYAHFSTIVDTLSEFKALEHLVLQIAPDATSTILDDLDRINKGSLSLRDCWQEVDKSYDAVFCRLLDREKITHLPLLQTFESYDYQIDAVKETLDVLYSGYAHYWDQTGPGIWKRNFDTYPIRSMLEETPAA